MLLGVKSRKILWARSGNMCAFPGCRQSLTESSESAAFVIGEECHIVARSPSGPRGSVRETNVDSHLNFILLCPTHHRVIDEQPGVFPAPALQEMKAGHEARVREFRSEIQIDTKELPIGDICRDLHVATVWTIEDSVLAVCSFGSPPVVLLNHRRQGSGFEFHHHKAARTETLFVNSEAEPDVQYWVEGHTLHILQQTYDPDSDSLVPFLEHMFDTRQIPAVRHKVLVFPQSTKPPTPISELVERLRAHNELSPLEREKSLFRLRNSGIRDPDSALYELRLFKTIGNAESY